MSGIKEVKRKDIPLISGSRLGTAAERQLPNSENKE